VLESRLGEERPRKPYPLMEGLRIIWLMEYFQIPQRRLKETLGVSRSSVWRWLKGFEQGKLGKRNEPKEPVNKTPREIAELIWEIFRRNTLWGRHRIAMTLWALGVFLAASTVRNILRHGPPKHIITDQEGVFVSDAGEHPSWAALAETRSPGQSPLWDHQATVLPGHTDHSIPDGCVVSGRLHRRLPRAVGSAPVTWGAANVWEFESKSRVLELGVS
jgi:transposase